MNVHPAANQHRDDRSDSQIVASLVVKYYDWLTDNGGVSPDELLALPLTQQQRKHLLKRIDDVLTIYGLTAEIGSDRRPPGLLRA
jgi:hypothetical protein